MEELTEKLILKIKGIIYKTTNLINGKIYVGRHAAIKIKEKYLGSGVLLRKAIKKYGKENFIREILGEYEWNSKEEMNLCESEWIKKLDATNLKIGYNLTTVCGGGDTLSGKSIFSMQVEKLGLEEAMRKNEAKNEKISQVRKANGNTKGEKNGMFGKCAYDIWIENEGLEVADKKKKESIEKRRDYKGKNNPNYGNGDKVRGEKNGMFNKTLTKEQKDKQIFNQSKKYLIQYKNKILYLAIGRKGLKNLFKMLEIKNAHIKVFLKNKEIEDFKLIIKI